MANNACKGSEGSPEPQEVESFSPMSVQDIFRRTLFWPEGRVQLVDIISVFLVGSPGVPAPLLVGLDPEGGFRGQSFKFLNKARMQT